MNWIDIVILLIVAGSAFSGLSQGAVRTAISFVGFIAAIFLAGRYYPEVAQSLFSSDKSWGPILGYVIIFIVVTFAASVIGWILSRVVKATLLGWIDKLVGGVIGAVTGFLTCAALLAVVMKYLPATDTVIAGSALAGFLLDKFPLVLALLPGEFGSIRDFFTATPKAN
jgi:membrane protein required for colicin V production